MSLTEILALLSAEKNNRGREARNLYARARNGEAYSVTLVSQLQREEKILEGTIQVLETLNAKRA